MTARKDYLVQMARLAQAYGFVPIPIKDKIPQFKNWQNVRYDPADPDKNIRRIQHLYDAGLANNIGILTGEPSGVVVVDVEKSALKWWKQLIQLNGDQPVFRETFTVQTGNGGIHVYFKYEPRTSSLTNRNKISGQGIDFRTNGGQAIFPGSITTHEYQVLSGYTPQGPIIGIMPDWLINFLANY